MKMISYAGFRQGEDWGFWFRVFGYGIAVSTMSPLFSERHGFRKAIRVFGVKIELLKGDKK